jgi:hypothetical protein
MTDSPTPARANSELLALVSTRARSEQHHQYMHQIQDYYISIGIQSVLSAWDMIDIISCFALSPCFFHITFHVRGFNDSLIDALWELRTTYTVRIFQAGAIVAV